MFEDFTVFSGQLAEHFPFAGMPCRVEQGWYAHHLSLVALFKDEADTMDEWLRHYLEEGADHFSSSTTVALTTSAMFCDRI